VRVLGGRGGLNIEEEKEVVVEEYKETKELEE